MLRTYSLPIGAKMTYPAPTFLTVDGREVQGWWMDVTTLSDRDQVFMAVPDFAPGNRYHHAKY